MEKEYLYVGHYVDINGNYVLKIGTTNNLTKRRYQHNQYYRKQAKHHPMPKEESFVYDWFKEFALSNTQKYEKNTKHGWKSQEFGDYIPNDRFVCEEKPRVIQITIRKT